MPPKRKTTTAAKGAATAGVAVAEAPDTVVTDSGAEIVLRTNFMVIEQDVIALMHAASLLIDADDDEKLNAALDNNLKLWIAIRTVIQNEDNSLPADVKDNLRNLAQYVSDCTLAAGQGQLDNRRLIAMARINMHIAEGLLRGQQRKMIEERAYEIWEREGRPDGRDLEHWAMAEREIADMIGVS